MNSDSSKNLVSTSFLLAEYTDLYRGRDITVHRRDLPRLSEKATELSTLEIKPDIPKLEAAIGSLFAPGTPVWVWLLYDTIAQISVSLLDREKPLTASETRDLSIPVINCFIEHEPDAESILLSFSDRCSAGKRTIHFDMDDFLKAEDRERFIRALSVSLDESGGCCLISREM